MVNDEQLSKDFSLYDYLKSSTAERFPEIKEQQFNPPLQVVANIKKTNVILQSIRDYVFMKHSCFVRISSGYRCADLNVKVGGSATSQHCFGEAVDFEIYDKNGKEVDGKTYKEVSMRIALNMNYRQMIKEFGTTSVPSWIHVAQRDGDNKKQNLEIGSHTGGKYVALDFNKWIV